MSTDFSWYLIVSVAVKFYIQSLPFNTSASLMFIPAITIALPVST